MKFSRAALPFAFLFAAIASAVVGQFLISAVCGFFWGVTLCDLLGGDW